jgi:hypothetical protein
MLIEKLSYDQAGIVTETKENDQGGKDLYMEGIFVQANQKNQNQRIYPGSEIKNAVQSITERIDKGFSVLGEADHPEDLQVNLDRVSHMIQKMWMNGDDGHGRLKLLPTPMGNICKTLLEAGAKLGVSSRGSGEVGHDGIVKGFEIQTVDIVANPSAPDAYPSPIYEAIMNGKRGNVLMDVANATNHDTKAQKYLQEEVLKLINNLDIRRK